MNQIKDNVSLSVSRLHSIVLMDICTVGLLKERESAFNGSDERKKKRITQLDMMVKSGKYQFSFLVAIIEKATDYTHVLSAEELASIFQSDYDRIVDFLGYENMVETREFLSKMIHILMDSRFSMEERAELSLRKSIDLLNYFNTLRVFSTPAKELRFEFAKLVAAEGERLGLGKGYPTIAVCIASIYGCGEARKILKVKKDGSKFNPSNRLGDIMTFYRVAKARHMVYSRISDVPVIFRTEDAALEDLHSYMHTRVIGENANEGSLMNTKCLAPDKLFPALHKDGKCTDPNELKNLYNLLNFIIENQNNEPSV